MASILLGSTDHHHEAYSGAVLLVATVLAVGPSPAACDIWASGCLNDVQTDSAEITLAARSEDEVKAMAKKGCEEVCDSIGQELCGQSISNLVVTPSSGHSGGLNQYRMTLTCTCSRNSDASLNRAHVTVPTAATVPPGPPCRRA